MFVFYPEYIVKTKKNTKQLHKYSNKTIIQIFQFFKAKFHEPSIYVVEQINNFSPIARQKTQFQKNLPENKNSSD